MQKQLNLTVIVFALAMAALGMAACSPTGLSAPDKPLQPFEWQPVDGVSLRVDREVRDDGLAAAVFTLDPTPLGLPQAHQQVIDGICNLIPGTSVGGRVTVTDYANVYDYEPLFIGYDEEPIDDARVSLHVSLGWKMLEAGGKAPAVYEYVSCTFAATGSAIQMVGALKERFGQREGATLRVADGQPPVHAYKLRNLRRRE